MSPKLNRPSPALVLASIALFVALGGSSYAALKIGTKGLKDGSVTSAKIKDGAILARDIAKKARRGPAGPEGARGAAGAAGAPGPTASGFASANPAPNVVPASCCPSPPQYVGMISTDVTMPVQGRLIASASLAFAGGTGGFVGCRLQVANGPGFTAWEDMSQLAENSEPSGQLPLVAGIDRPAGTYRIRAACYDNSDWLFDRGDITAMATAS